MSSVSIRNIIFIFLFCVFVEFCRHPSQQSDSSNRLYQFGDVTLENATAAYGLLRTTCTFGAAVYDANNDGWPDLLISNHGRTPQVFLNERGITFREAPELLRVQPSDRHAPELADFDNDGDQDLYFLHGAHLGQGLGPKELFLNTCPRCAFVLTDNQVLQDPKGRGRTSVWFDYDGDGFLDLFNAYHYRADAPNRLFHNNGDGSFTDVSEKSGVMLSIDSEGGAIAGDIDNDGDMDLVVANTGDRPYLFINDGKGIFHDETFARGIPAIPATWAIGMTDFNNDGYLDLYFSRGKNGRADGALLTPHRLNFVQIVNPPNDREDVLNFAADENAVVTFEFNVSSDVRSDALSLTYIGSNGVHPHKNKFAVGSEGNGRPVQWKSDGSNQGTFIWKDPTTHLWTIATGAGPGFFESAGIVTSNGKLSQLNLVHMEKKPEKEYPNLLLQNNGNGTFRDVTQQTRTGSPTNDRSALWVDLDNDGDLDLFIVSASPNGAGNSPDICYINENGVFHPYNVPMGLDEELGRGDGGLVADFNGDGRQDLFILNGSGSIPFSQGPYELLMNRTKNHNNWIDFQLIGGSAGFTNRDAIGSKVMVQAGTRILWRFILGGSGSDCQSSRTLHFGLGNATDISATVYWPPGKKFPGGHRSLLHFSNSQLNHTYIIKETG